MNTVPEFLPILSHGSHINPSQGACVMEMVSFLAGEEFSDQPTCVHLNVREKAIEVNDFVSDDNRSQIALLIPRFMGTNVEALETQAFFEDTRAFHKAFKAEHKLDITTSTVSGINKRFKTDKGDERLTNQEYDQIAIDYLNGYMDIVDKHMCRKEAPSVDIYAETMKSHASQKVNA